MTTYANTNPSAEAIVATRAEAAASRQRFQAGDRVLVRRLEHEPGTVEGCEATHWCVVVRVRLDCGRVLRVDAALVSRLTKGRKAS